MSREFPTQRSQRQGEEHTSISPSEQYNRQHRHLDRHSNTVMSESQVTLRTRKFIRNPLLGRKQMVVYVQQMQQWTIVCVKVLPETKELIILQ